MVQKDGNLLPIANLQQAFHAHEKPFHMEHSTHPQQKPALPIYVVGLALE